MFLSAIAPLWSPAAVLDSMTIATAFSTLRFSFSRNADTSIVNMLFNSNEPISISPYVKPLMMLLCKSSIVCN